MADALVIRPPQIDVDDPKMEGTGFTIRKFQMRGRFAMRLADFLNVGQNQKFTACPSRSAQPPTSIFVRVCAK